MNELLKRRKELDLTLEQVGDMCGVGKSTVRKWENGQINNMGRDKIVALANALQVSPLYILNAESSERILSPFDKKILSYSDKLNDIGKKKALDNVKDLTLIPSYCNNKNDNPQVIAAHNDNADDEEQQRLMQEDLDNF